MVKFKKRLTVLFENVYSYPLLPRIGIFIIILILFWLPFAIPIYWLISDSNLVSILTMAILFINFLFLVKFWGKYVEQEAKIFQKYGLIFNRLNGIFFLNGLSLGLIFTLGLFILEAILGLINFQSTETFWLKLILEGLLTGVGVAFAEEIFFRGWLLFELEKNYSQNISLYLNALIFATLHFLKPLPEIIRTFPQFPGLILLGIILITAKRKHHNLLGNAMGLHGGLVWGYYIINVGNLVQFSPNISPFITGVDNNPLAGLIGILMLLVLFLITKKF